MRFASWIFDRNSAKIRQIDTYQKMDAFLKGLNLKVSFPAYALKTDGIECSPKEWEMTAQYLEPQLNALIARYSKLGENAFYKYYIPVDETVQKALVEME